MIYLWLILQVAPVFIAMWLHSCKSKETYFTKDTVLKTITDFVVMSFMIIILVYGVMYLKDPNEIVELEMFSGGKLIVVGFVFKYAITSLVASIIVGILYSLDIRGIFKTSKKTEEGVEGN